MNFICPDWNAPSQVRAMTTSRVGGVSKGEYRSLNLGAHVGDCRDAVLNNRRRLFKEARLPGEPVWLDQTHSTNIVELFQSGACASYSAQNCDGALTSQRDTVCVVMTADCLPLFLSNKKGTRVGLVHAGWRGLADGIVEQAVVAMGEPANEILAWAGPCISVQHFEIGDEVQALLGGSAGAYRPSDKPHRCYADLGCLVGERLARLGVNEFSCSPHCTYAEQDLFFSHRRDGITGRMASLIWIDSLDCK